jgi:hypothetical protein
LHIENPPGKSRTQLYHSLMKSLWKSRS